MFKSPLSKPYLIFVNGTLAKRHLTLGGAIKTAIQYFPSYVVDSRNNAVVWTGRN